MMNFILQLKNARIYVVIIFFFAVALFVNRSNFSIIIKENILIMAILLGLVLVSLLITEPTIVPRHQKEEKVFLVRVMILSGFLFSFLYFYAVSVSKGIDISVKVVLPAIHKFEDFFNPLYGWEHFHFFAGDPGRGEEVRHLFIYFPATYVFFNVFSIFKREAALAFYLIIFSIYFLFYSSSNLKIEKRAPSIQDGLICLFFSFPTMFMMTTGNIEGVVFISLSLFIFFYQKGKMIFSAFLLGVAIAMKLYPAVFLVLLIADKHYKEMFYTIGFIVILTLFPLLVYDGGFNGGIFNYWNRLMGNLARYNEIFIIKGIGIAWGNSLFNAVRILLGPYFPEVSSLIRPWVLSVAIVFPLLAAYVIFIEKVLWKRVTVLLVAMNTLTFISADYKLLHIFIPLFLLVNNESEDRYDFGYLFLMSLLLIPKNYFELYNKPSFGLTFVLDPLIMIIIASFIIVSGLKNRRVDRGVIRRSRRESGLPNEGFDSRAS